MQYSYQISSKISKQFVIFRQNAQKTNSWFLDFFVKRLKQCIRAFLGTFSGVRRLGKQDPHEAIPIKCSYLKPKSWLRACYALFKLALE